MHCEKNDTSFQVSMDVSGLCVEMALFPFICLDMHMAAQELLNRFLQSLICYKSVRTVRPFQHLFRLCIILMMTCVHICMEIEQLVFF
jgi:hypothetical protein